MRFFSKVLTVALGLTMGVTAWINFTKADTSDSCFSGSKISYYGFSSSTYSTDLRTKDDKTSHYIKNQCTAVIRVKSMSSTGVDCTEGKYAVCSSPIEYLVHNQIRENGYSKCYLEISMKNYGTSTYVNGCWSPDSVGRYPAANVY